MTSSFPYGDVAYGDSTVVLTPAPRPTPPASVDPGIGTLLGGGSYNGLSWGPGTDFHIVSLAGVDDLPVVRTSDASRASDHGVWRGQDFLDKRIVQLGIGIIAADNATFYADVARAEGAFQPQQNGELPLLLFNSNRLINCRTRRREMPYETEYRPRVGTMKLELHAGDPRVYDAALTTLFVLPGITSPGRAWPWIWPIAWGGPSSTGSVLATNKGNWETRPLITMVGPCTNPSIANQTGGKTLTFNLTLAGTDTLVIDLDARSVVLNGTASRRSAMAPGSQWWNLPPGSSTLAFAAASSATGCQATITFRSAWM